MSIADATASDGTTLDLDSLPQVLGYSGGKLTTITVTTGDGNTYVQTLSYTGDDLTGISAWIKQ